ncbi:MAG TPA: macro domain-containing protein [Actinocrinis sp.]|uniref:type II toxin-antitoxin system antitoxin DNA ADP-ribosyl glycohydrolase DarG n=1 Tax=Actinocrinis sp. TaxID=1920516 RepID=UPI002DDC9E29|nr:macro domain-containing protein [Actinocrinis sp.]HEV2346208.1 macro domain-containing protein [Actinocrinis sp.]
MIEERRGNLLRDDAQALINPVNTVGVMGKGLALQFKRAFPEVYAAYREAFERGEVQPGRVLATPLEGTRWVLNFPTKRHWRDRSTLEDIEAGLDDLVRVLRERGIHSVAVPPLGCGNGGLRWQTVRPLIVEKLAPLSIEVHLYLPGTPPAADMPTAGPAPVLTQPLARLLAALGRYIAAAWNSGVTEEPKASLLEVQKVAYLLQSAGADLDLRFVPYKYGPFSATLNRELAASEGHHILGYGDGTGGARADIEVFEESTEQAESAVDGDSMFATAWGKVAHAVRGYEYPEGMELLASAHYLANRASRVNPAEIATQMAAWTPRKATLFGPADVTDALGQLTATGLLAPVAT